jgi:hypothetical protein
MRSKGEESCLMGRDSAARELTPMCKRVALNLVVVGQLEVSEGDRVPTTSSHPPRISFQRSVMEKSC